MKKSLAFVGASALGLVAATAAASPALAADATVDCTDMNAQVAATGHLTDNWYQDCVPQYGLGKAEFSIVADEDDPTAEFPAAFVPLDDVGNPAVTVSSTPDSATLDAYLQSGGSFAASINPVDSDLSDPTIQRYTATVIAPVTSIGEVTTPVPANVEAQCEVSTSGYGGGWVATFGAVDTRFTQTIDGETWSYDITASPLPTYFFATFSGGVITGDWCVTDGERAFYGSDDQGSSVQQIFGLVFNSIFSIGDGTPEIVDLGTFARSTPDVPVIPVDPKPAVLAETGLNAMDAVIPAVIAGGVVLVGGGLLTAAAIRRRRNRA